MMNNQSFNLEEKDIFKLFNQIKIEESDFIDMDEEVQTIQKERIKKNLNKRISGKRNLRALKYGTSVAAIALVSIIGISTISPAFAKNIPVLNSITQTLNDKNGNHNDGEYAKYSQIVNKTITNNGISITINDIIADDSKLIIGYTVKSDKKIDSKEIFSFGKFLKVNGNYLGSGGTVLTNYSDDNTYICSEEIHTTLPKTKMYNIELNVTEIADVKGNWNFAFSASREDLCTKTTVFNINKKIDLPDSTVNIDKVEFSPIDTSIFYSGKMNDSNVYENASLPFSHNWLIYDDKGVQLMSKGEMGKTNKDTLLFTSESTFFKVKSIPKYLTFIPYDNPISKVEKKVLADGSVETTTIEKNKSSEISKIIDGIYPIELSQGKLGKLIIKEIKIESDKTIVEFTAEGKAPCLQASNLYINNDKGERISFKSTLCRDNKHPNDFTTSFEALDPNKKYTICTSDFNNIELREDLKFNIQLKK